MSPLANITYYIPHIIQLKFSTKYTHHIITKIRPQNYTIPTQSPTSFGLWAKLKESPNFKSPTTMWLIPKSHYDVANSKSPTTMWLIPKSHYDEANSKSPTPANSKYPTTMWQIQNPLWCGTIYKNRYDTTLFTKPVATQQYFTKSQNHFHKAQIPIWHLFSQSPNSYLALFYKAQILIWHYFIKPKYYFGNSFIKPKY